MNCRNRKTGIEVSSNNINFDGGGSDVDISPTSLSAAESCNSSPALLRKSGRPRSLSPDGKACSSPARGTFNVYSHILYHSLFQKNNTST